MNRVLFSPDGKWLAFDYSGGTNKKKYVFDTEIWFEHSVGYIFTSAP